VNKNLQLTIFGCIDGLVIFLGLTIGLIVAHQSQVAVWHAALGGAGGELVGMTAGQHLSDPESGWSTALLCGVSSAVACLLPAIPYVTMTHNYAIIISLVVAVVIAGVIARMRPEHGMSAVVRTYGIIIAAGIISGLTGLV